MGLIAQKLESVSLELIIDVLSALDDDTEMMIEPEEIRTVMTKAVNYNGLIPVLIAGIQEQQQQMLLLAALVLFVLGTLASPVFARQPAWELMLEDVHGPIAVDPSDSDVIYVAVRGTTSLAYSSGMLKSTDGGQTWQHYTEGWLISDPKDILIHPDNPGEILVSGGTGVAVVKSTDGGQTWERADYGVTGSSHGTLGYKLVYHRHDKVYYLAQDAGGMDGGVYRSENGVQWEQILSYPGTTTVLVDEENDVIYAGTIGGHYLMRSTDGGQTWEEKFEGMTRRVNHLARVPGSHTLYAATSGGVYKSYDMAESWISVNDTLSEQHIFSGGLAVSKSDTNTVFAGARGVFVSRNSGITLDRIEFDIPDSIRINTLHLFFDNQRKRLFANYALIYVPNEYHIYILNDALATDATDLQNEGIEVPKNIKLNQNYPNPFNPVTVIEYALPEPAEVTLRIYDVMGRLVETLVEQAQSPGRYQARWDGSGAASGIYIYRLKAGDVVTSRKMMLIK